MVQKKSGSIVITSSQLGLQGISDRGYTLSLPIVNYPVSQAPPGYLRTVPLNGLFADSHSLRQKNSHH
jgi:hypothetical protein